MDIVLGFGMVGIGAYFANNSLMVYEKSNIPGGLCGGFYIGDFDIVNNGLHI